MTDPSEPWPTEIRLNKDKDVLVVNFDDGKSFDFAAEYLRVHSPSAEVQGHSAAQRVTVGGKKGVRISNLEQVGNYAVKIIFDDGHSTGLFTWSYLYELGETHDERWAFYVEELSAKGLSRG